jgi:protein gp37
VTTTIEWTDTTWNPTSGCDRISDGCTNCYALPMAKRLKAMGQAKYQADGDPRTSGPGFGLTVHPDTLDEPYRWRKPRMVFVNSMSDLFHARVPASFIADVWRTMQATSQHTYQILTKRPERLARVLDQVHAELDLTQPLTNVWLGTSIESDGYIRRADALRQAPAAVRFISAEPLLGPLPSADFTGIDWVILGGESGPGARPLELDWVRDVIGQCRTAGAAPFVKQLGTVWARTNGAADKKGGKTDDWPTDLRVREYPAAA